MHLELGEPVRPVGLDGFDADAQRGGDLLGRFAVGDEAGGFSFAVGKGGEFAVSARVKPGDPPGILASGVNHRTVTNQTRPG